MRQSLIVLKFASATEGLGGISQSSRLILDPHKGAGGRECDGDRVTVGFKARVCTLADKLTELINSK